MADNFYCSQKFWWLTIDTEKLSTQSCCAATPHKIDIDWISKNPGNIFNTPKLQQERTMMLDNIPVASCYSNCWEPESKGNSSRRTAMNSQEKSHVNISSSPETLNIMIGSHCNLTCVYCCKQNSTAWLTDIDLNGPYEVDGFADRFTINNKDRVIHKISQKELNNSPNKKILLNEIKLICQNANLTDINISGGEPFLYLFLTDLLDIIPSTITVGISTGLGIDEKKFTKILDKLIKYQNLSISISAESIGEYYEFIRTGNTWQRFLNNLAEIKKREINYQYNSVLSNLTLFGINDFVKFADGATITYQPCNDPNFLSINTIDPISKQVIQNNIDRLPMEVQILIKNSMNVESTIQQQTNLKKYLLEFSNRKKLNLNIFPKHFINWINE
jgi:MoaA/NifB/PqqE/SkfB family radical SAM enzyme